MKKYKITIETNGAIVICKVGNKSFHKCDTETKLNIIEAMRKVEKTHLRNKQQ